MSEGRQRRLFVHVEEPSMEAAIRVLVPVLTAAATPLDTRIIDHGSKYALLRDLPDRFAGYAKRKHEDIRVMVLVDRDREDCRVLKSRLEAAAHKAGLATKTSPRADAGFIVCNRVVVEELEAWFVGDEAALRQAYPRIPSGLSSKLGFREPDAIKGGTWEALHRVVTRAGYFPGSTRLPKIEVARAVAHHMIPERNLSRSFQHFVSGLQALLA